MTNKKQGNWGSPPIVELALKLQKFINEHKKAELEQQLYRAQKMLQFYMTKAKDKVDGQ